MAIVKGRLVVFTCKKCKKTLLDKYQHVNSCVDSTVIEKHTKIFEFLVECIIENDPSYLIYFEC